MALKLIYCNVDFKHSFWEPGVKRTFGSIRVCQENGEIKKITGEWGRENGGTFKRAGAYIIKCSLSLAS